MSIKNVFTDDVVYETIPVSQWSALVASTIPAPPSVSLANVFAVVSSMNGGTFAPETTGTFGFNSSNFYSVSSAITSPGNDQIQFTAAGIYRIDFQILYTAGVGITAYTHVDTVSGSVIDILETNSLVTENFQTRKIITFIFDATAGTIVSVGVNVSAGSLGLSFDNLSSIAVSQLA